VTGLLWLEDRYRRDVAAQTTPPAAAEPEQADADDVGYPDVIVIDDEDDEDLAWSA
jgi:hypothetical protein